MRVVALCLFGAVILTAVTGVAVASENTPPLAAAGLDQTVPPDATVYLDANGSSDPDGEITGYEWTVETPAGTTGRPDCATCRQTSFDAAAVGQYTVTLTVTDDDGASRSDTLYVTVEREQSPTISLSGPTTTAPDSENVFTARAQGTDTALQTFAWVVDGDVLEQQRVSDGDVTRSLTRSFETTGEVTVTALAYDTLGRRGSATQTITVGSTGGALGTGNGCNNGNAWEGLCTGGGDALISTPDGTQYILDSNGEEGLQLTADDGDGLRTYEDPTSSESISRQSPGSDLYVVDDGVSVGDALDQTVSEDKRKSDESSINADTTQSGPDRFDNGDERTSNDADPISETDETVLSNIGITVPQQPETSASDGDDVSSDSNSDDSDDNNSDDSGNDGTDDNDSGDDNSGTSDRNKSGSKSSSDKGDSKKTKGVNRAESDGFVGL